MTRMTVRADMVNGHDIAHGGLVFSVADTAFACACNSFGPVAVAAAAEIVFVASARVGDVLDAPRRSPARGSAAPASTTSPCAAASERDRRVPRAAARRSDSDRSPARASGLRPRSPARGRRRGVQRARLRRHQHGGPLAPARHREVGDLPPRRPSKEELLRLALDRALGRSVRRRRRRAGGATAPAIDRLEFLVRGSVRGAAGAAALRDPAAARARQHRGRARRAEPAPRVRPSSWPTWSRRPRATATSAPTSTPTVTARLLFGLVNSVVEWYRPGRRSAAFAARRRLRDRLRRAAGSTRAETR